MHKYRPLKPPKPRNNSFINQGTSREELDLHKTINLLLPGMKTIKGDRAILEGREIDIYIPRLRTGIEYDGLAFHSDNKEPQYHQWKTLLAEKKSVRLIHIWSDLWTNKRGLVVDYLSKLFRKYQTIPFKDCFISEISEIEGRNFLENTHLLGCDKKANKFIGIYYQNYLITVAAFNLQDNIWTFLQKAERSTLEVENDLENIFSYVRDKYNIKEFNAEIDRSLFDGSDLKSIGFKNVSLSEPHAIWTKDFKTRKLQEKRTPEQLQKAGYHSFYDCGVLRMRLTY